MKSLEQLTEQSIQENASESEQQSVHKRQITAARAAADAWKVKRKILVERWTGSIASKIDEFEERAISDLQEKLSKHDGNFSFDVWERGYSRYAEEFQRELRRDFINYCAKEVTYGNVLYSTPEGHNGNNAYRGLERIVAPVVVGVMGVPLAMKNAFVGGDSEAFLPMSAPFWATTIVPVVAAPSGSKLLVGIAAFLGSSIAAIAYNATRISREEGGRGLDVLRELHPKRLFAAEVFNASYQNHRLSEYVSDAIHVVKLRAQEVYRHERPAAQAYVLQGQQEVESILGESSSN